MFTGIIEEVGKITSITNSTITIEAKTVLEGTKIGDSIAVDGVCLTVASMKKDSFTANVSKETFKVSRLSILKSGDYVNLERALTINTRLGGHIVTGHIDITSKISSLLNEREFYTLVIEIPSEYKNFVVKKGSLAINGISLTIANVEKDSVSVAVIPHTYENTVLKYLKKGDFVNLEFDVLAKYVENFLSTKDNSNITFEMLQKNGFV